MIFRPPPRLAKAQFDSPTKTCGHCGAGCAKARAQAALAHQMVILGRKAHWLAIERAPCQAMPWAFLKASVYRSQAPRTARPEERVTRRTRSGWGRDKDRAWSSTGSPRRLAPRQGCRPRFPADSTAAAKPGLRLPGSRAPSGCRAIRLRRQGRDERSRHGQDGRDHAGGRSWYQGSQAAIEQDRAATHWSARPLDARVLQSRHGRCGCCTTPCSSPFRVRTMSSQDRRLHRRVRRTPRACSPP